MNLPPGSFLTTRASASLNPFMYCQHLKVKDREESGKGRGKREDHSVMHPIDLEKNLVYSLFPPHYLPSPWNEKEGRCKERKACAGKEESKEKKRQFGTLCLYKNLVYPFTYGESGSRIIIPSPS